MNAFLNPHVRVPANIWINNGCLLFRVLFRSAQRTVRGVGEGVEETASGQRQRRAAIRRSGSSSYPAQLLKLVCFYSCLHYQAQPRFAQRQDDDDEVVT